MRITYKRLKETAESVAANYNIPIRAGSRNGYYTIDIMGPGGTLKCDPIIGNAGEIETALTAYARIQANTPAFTQLFKYRDKTNGNTYVLKINHGARVYVYPANVGISAICDAIPIRKKDMYSTINALLLSGYKKEV